MGKRKAAASVAGDGETPSFFKMKLQDHESVVVTFPSGYTPGLASSEQVHLLADTTNDESEKDHVGVDTSVIVATDKRVDFIGATRVGDGYVMFGVLRPYRVSTPTRRCCECRHRRHSKQPRKSPSPPWQWGEVNYVVCENDGTLCRWRSCTGCPTSLHRVLPRCSNFRSHIPSRYPTRVTLCTLQATSAAYVGRV